MYTNTNESIPFIGWGELKSNLLTINSVYSDREKAFTSADLDDNTQTVLVSTPEQFITLFKFSEQSGNFYPKANLTRNLYFQEDPIFKEGFINEFYLLCHRFTFDSADGQEKIIQGIQLTGKNFFYSDCYTCTFKNIYFKDFVHTKTVENEYTLHNNHSESYYTLRFINCKMSMHIRASEYGYEFDTTNITWDHCSRYIEFSDLLEDQVPARAVMGNQIMFSGSTSVTSTIVRNMAYYMADSSATIERPWGGLLTNSSNSSWDIEFGVVYFHNLYSENPVRIKITNITNCFISLKALSKIKYRDSSWPSTSVEFVTGISGVNVYNKGNDDDDWRLLPTSTNQGNVKALTDDECHSYATLNKYGFFVNHAYEYVLLTEEPDDWATHYNDYYYKIGDEYARIMAATAPTWAANTYYEKVYL